jgi:dienelactone hydrolase
MKANKAARIIAVCLAATLLGGCQTTAVSDTPEPVLNADVSGRIDFASFDAPPPGYWYAIYEGSYRRHPAVIHGTLILPDTTGGPVPAMVMLHDSGGISEAHEFAWADHLRGMGIAVFVVDSFAGRGVTNTIHDQSQVTGQSMIIDGYRALALLGRHPEIDQSRIGLMGFSKGGFATYLAAWQFFDSRLSENDLHFAAYIPVYGDCVFQQETPRLIGGPMLFLTGEQDDWTPAASCRRAVGAAATAGFAVELLTYPGGHSFDNPSSTSRTIEGAQNWADCKFFVDYGNPTRGFRYDGQNNWDPWSSYGSYEKNCLKTTASVAYNADSAMRARHDAGEFLSRIFFAEK